MKIKCISEMAKDSICLAYRNKTLNLKELASFFETSPRTIGRVLEERGLATPVPRLKGEAYQVMQFLSEKGMDLPGLQAALQIPVVTPSAVQSYLNQCSKQDLATHFYVSGLAKLAEIAQQVHANKQQETQPA